MSFDRPSRRLLGLHQVLLNPDTEKSVLHLFRAAHTNCSFNSPVISTPPPGLWVLLPSASPGFNLECLFQHPTLDFPKFVFLNGKQNIILTCNFIPFHCFGFVFSSPQPAFLAVQGCIMPFLLPVVSVTQKQRKTGCPCSFRKTWYCGARWELGEFLLKSSNSFPSACLERGSASAT